MANHNQNAPPVPRPARWETPRLDQRVGWYMPIPRFLNSIPDRMRSALTDHTNDGTARFLFTKLEFDHSDDWHVHRLLGHGSFGRVALWVHKDATGAITDEVALKEVIVSQPFVHQRDLFYVDSIGQEVFDLLNEAVIHTLINQYHSENITHLRGYKSVITNQFQAPNPSVIARPVSQGTPPEVFRQPGRHRFYMEYAPYGTLGRLIMLYRAWEQYLPEPFLWHVFDSLVTAAGQMARGLNQSIVGGEQMPVDAGDEIVHFDIKPGNIFLGYETLQDVTTAANQTGGSSRFGYPTIKLSDFGLAEITSDHDARNPRSFWHRGTRFFQPPEQIHYGVQFDDPPNGPFRPVIDRGGNDHDIVGERESAEDCYFLRAANVWAIGKVMYDLATLSEGDTFQNHWDLREREYNQNQRHVLPDFQNNPFTFLPGTVAANRPAYSPRLMHLIRECLRPAIRDRITLNNLRVQVGNELQQIELTADDDAHNNALPHSDVLRRQLYYRGNEINNMPLGNAGIHPSDNDYVHLTHNRFDDPDWEALRLPPGKWQAHIDADDHIVQPSHQFVLANGGIRFPDGLGRSRDTTSPSPKSTPSSATISSLHGASLIRQSDNARTLPMTGGRRRGTSLGPAPSGVGAARGRGRGRGRRGRGQPLSYP